jgi:hypothetical protein
MFPAQQDSIHQDQGDDEILDATIFHPGACSLAKSLVRTRIEGCVIHLFNDTRGNQLQEVRPLP